MSHKEIVVSGIRSTGHLHLGNLLGAIKQMEKMQETYSCYFFIADYHSLTTHPAPGDFHQNVRQVLVEYMAAGLDPEKCVLYVQSEVPEIPELYLLLNMNAYLGELERCTSFKEKIRKQSENINSGLLTYPVLMAADILIHKGAKVPVGKDQEQHLEMSRRFARRFNNMYQSQVFPEPEAFNFGKELIKVPGLDGSGKMGKSEGESNAIFLTDEPAKIKKKIMSAVSDSGPEKPDQPKTEAVSNLFQLLSFVSGRDTLDHFENLYNNCTIRYGDLKKQLAEDMIIYLEPYRNKIAEIQKDDELISKTVKKGTEKARESASGTLQEVRKAMGFRNF